MSHKTKGLQMLAYEIYLFFKFLSHTLKIPPVKAVLPRQMSLFLKQGKSKLLSWWSLADQKL